MKGRAVLEFLMHLVRSFLPAKSAKEYSLFVVCSRGGVVRDCGVHFVRKYLKDEEAIENMRDSEDGVAGLLSHYDVVSYTISQEERVVLRGKM
jgi:hypothetical protein